MSSAPPAVCEPVEGEVLHFSRWYTAAAVAAVPTGLFMGSFGLAFVLLAELVPEIAWLIYATGGLGLLEAGLLFWATWYCLTRKPRLLLGRDRLQLWVGRHLRWQVGNGDIGEIALYVPVHGLFGYRMPWLPRSLGIRLLSPERFDASYPQLAKSRARRRRLCGFDLSIPMTFSYEPAERCLEALLRRYHRFAAEQRGPS